MKLLSLLGLGTIISLGVYASPSAPNFVVILTDDQSWVGTSLQIDPNDERTRSDYFRTPQIERLAREGMQFTRGYAPAPFCCPTRRSLLIGQTPARHIYQKNQTRWTANYREQLTLPQMLKQANPDYRTAHFGKWDMRFDDVTPQQVGYDVSDGYTDNGTGGGKGAGGPAASDDPKLIFGITDRTGEFMAASKRAGRPFFVQVSHYAVHLDVFYRKETLAETKGWKKGAKHTMPEFAAMTSDVDTGIGMILDRIESLGLSETTYVFFLSDNGGRNSIPGQKGGTLERNSPLRRGKGSVFEGGIRVPFLVKGPGVLANSVSDVPVTGLDIFPTVAELAGYSRALPPALDGGSLTPVVHNGGRGEVTRNQPFLLFHQAIARRAETALLSGDYKLVKTWASGRLELFDLSADVEEANDLSESHPKQTKELHNLMVDFMNEVGAATEKTGTKSEVYETANPSTPSI